MSGDVGVHELGPESGVVESVAAFSVTARGSDVHAVNATAANANAISDQNFVQVRFRTSGLSEWTFRGLRAAANGSSLH
jgi:hypothetical protein